MAAAGTWARQASTWPGISRTAPCRSCSLAEEGAAWHQPAALLGVQERQGGGDVASPEIQAGHQGSSSQKPMSWQSPAWLLRQGDVLHVSGCSGWDPVASPRSAGCCRGGGTKLGHGLLPGRGLCPQAELPEDVPRSSESRRSLEGAARLTPWTTPLQLGRLLGGQGQGSPLGRCRFPVDAECHLLLPAAPGVFGRTPRRGCCSSWAILSEVPELPQRLVSTFEAVRELHARAQPASFLGLCPEPDFVFHGLVGRREEMGRW